MGSTRATINAVEIISAGNHTTLNATYSLDGKKLAKDEAQLALPKGIYVIKGQKIAKQ